MLCNVCGAQIPDNAAFCGKCGSRSHTDEPPATPMPSTQCPKCGVTFGGHAAFCPSCGFRIQTEAVSPPPFTPPYAPQAYPGVVPHRKKKKGLAIVLVILVLLIAGGAGGYFLFGREIRNVVLGPKSAYALVEAKNLKEDFAVLVDVMSRMGNLDERAATGGHEVNLQIALSDDALDMSPQVTSAIAGIVLRDRLQIQYAAGDPDYFNTLSLRVGEEDILSLDALVNSRTILLGLPDILDSYVHINPAMLTEPLDGEVADQAAELDILKILTTMDLSIERPDLEKSLMAMAKIFMEHIDDATYESAQVLHVGDVSASYGRYTVSISAESMRAAVIDLLLFVQDDDAIYNLVGRVLALGDNETAAPITREEYTDLLVEAIQKTTDREVEDITVVQSIYVDDSDNIVGRDLVVEDAVGTSSFRLRFAHPVDGEKEAVLLHLESGGEPTLFQSEFTRVQGKRTGTAFLTEEGAQVMRIEFTGMELVDTGSMSYPVGNVRIIPEVELERIDMDLRMDGEDYLIDVEASGLGSLSITYRAIAEGQIAIPDLSTVSTVDIDNTEALQALVTEDALLRLKDAVERLGFSLDGIFPASETGE